MPRRLILTLFLLALAVLGAISMSPTPDQHRAIQQEYPAPVRPDGKPSARFESESIDLGKVRPGAIAQTSFKFTNVGTGMLKIFELRPSCDCVQVELDPREFKPAESGIIHVTFNAADRDMTRSLKIVVNSNDADTPSRVLKLAATVQSLLQIEPIDLFFGPVTRGSEATKSVVLKSKDGSAFAIKSATVTPADFELEPFSDKPSDSQLIVVKARPASPPRAILGQLTIVIDRDNAPIHISVSMVIREKITATPGSIVIQTKTRGEPLERTIVLEAAENVTFKIASAKTELGVFSCSVTDVIPGRKYQINVTFTAPVKDTARLFIDHLIVETDSSDRPVFRIPLSTVILEN